MNGKYTVALLAMAFPCLAFGQDSGSYQCTYGELQRRVEILTEPGVTVPCEVHYYKDTEAPGEKQVLWSATSQAGYCESKTEEFITQLEGWGWNCGRGDVAMPAEPQAPVDMSIDEVVEDVDEDAYDDTDVLSPATPSGIEVD